MLGQVDDAVDLDPRGGSARADGDDIPGSRVEVRRGLLVEEHAGARSGEHADHARERGAVAVGQPEHAAGPGLLRRPADRSREAAGAREGHRQRAGDAGVVPGRCEDCRGACAGLRLDLPVDGHLLDGAPGHLRGRRGQEGPDRRQERHADGDAERGRDEAAAAVRQQPSDPAQRDHASS